MVKLAMPNQIQITIQIRRRHDHLLTPSNMNVLNLKLLYATVIASLMTASCLAQTTIESAPREFQFDYEDFSPIEARLNDVQSQANENAGFSAATGKVQAASYEIQKESEGATTISPSPSLRLKPRTAIVGEVDDIDSPIDSSSIRTIGALAIVLATFFFVAWLFRKNQGGKDGDSSLFTVLASQNLDREHQIHLITFGDRLLVIGTTGSSMQCLSEMHEKEQIGNIVEQLKQTANKPENISKKQSESFHEILSGFPVISQTRSSQVSNS